MRPWALSGSLKYPASPTSAQPGPHDRQHVAGAGHANVRSAARRLGGGQAIGELGRRARRRCASTRRARRARCAPGGRWRRRRPGRRWSGSHRTRRRGGSSTRSRPGPARTSSRRCTRSLRCPCASVRASTRRRPSSGCRRRRRRGRRTPGASARRPTGRATPVTRLLRSRVTSVTVVPKRTSAPASTRGVDEDRIEHGPSRRVQGVDTGGRLDVDGDDRRRRSGTWCAGSAACRRRRSGRAGPSASSCSTPARIRRVRRQGVGAVAAAVDDEHVEAGAGEQMAVAAPAARAPTTTTSEWRRGARDASRVSSGSRTPPSWRRTAVRWVMCSATWAASRPTPPMKLELRQCWKRWPSTYRPGTGVTPRRWRSSPRASSTGICSQS